MKKNMGKNKKKTKYGESNSTFPTHFRVLLNII
jgi:uncharacterized protein Veg